MPKTVEPTAQAEIERKVMRCVITGKDYTKEGKIGVVVRILDENDNMGDTKFFLAQSFKAIVGGIYTYEASVDGTLIWPGTVKYVGPWKDGPQRLAWYSASRAFEVAHDARRVEYNETRRNLIEETLEPLRRAYLITNAKGKIALKALVLHYLENGNVDI